MFVADAIPPRMLHPECGTYLPVCSICEGISILVLSRRMRSTWGGVAALKTALNIGDGLMFEPLEFAPLQQPPAHARSGIFFPFIVGGIVRDHGIIGNRLGPFLPVEIRVLP